MMSLLRSLFYSAGYALTAFVLILGGFSICAGQELNATVEVDKSQISGTSLAFLDNLSREIENYLNEYDWIDPGFQEIEKINVHIQIILVGADEDYNFEANIVIRSQRPVYNSLQQTTLFLYNDENWTFTYTPNRGFVHDELQFDSITTLLDFYAYIILGYDFDSFSELGGTPYFNEAQNLVALAQTTSSPGWSRTGNVPRNRAQLAADLLNPGFAPLRRAIYTYHRQGLDRFLDDPRKARQQILTALETIGEAIRNTTNNLLFNTFFNAKYREIVSVFKDAPLNVRLEAHDMLSEIDPAHLSVYDELQ